LAAGGLWLCLWRKGWRQWGWLAIAAGLGSAALVRPPDVLIDGDAKLVAVRSPDGGLMVSSTKIAKFVSEIWLRRSGEAQSTAWPGADPSGRLRCDSFGCIFRPGGHTVALPFSDAALTEDCLTADVVVSRVPVRRGCPSAHVVIDRFDLWREGAHALWFTGDGVRVESAGAGQGARPWSLHRERKRKKPKPEGGKI
jgi:competence protein ComEC